MKINQVSNLSLRLTLLIPAGKLGTVTLEPCFPEAMSRLSLPDSPAHKWGH